MSTQIPAQRAPLIDGRTGQISREWYIYFFSLFNKTRLGADFLFGVTVVSSDFYPDNDSLYLMCTGNTRIYLQEAEKRESIISITNAGSGTITIIPAAGEFIRSDSTLELDFQWSSVQLCPKLGGYAII